MFVHVSVFDKLIWCTIGFLFGTAQFSLWASSTVNYDYIVTNSINYLLIVFPMAHTLTIAEPIWPMLQNSGTHISLNIYSVCIHTYMYIYI